MFIQTEETPNPATLKFIPDGAIVSPNNNLEFKNKEDAVSKSALASELLSVDGVEAIFLGRDFITITKSKDFEWKMIKTEIMAIIVDFFAAGKEAVFENSKNHSNVDENDSDIVKQIKELIEIKVRPAVAMDGGDIVFRSFEDGIVYLELKGSCSGCPSSSITLKNGIENMFKHYIPEVVGVEQVNDD